MKYELVKAIDRYTTETTLEEEEEEELMKNAAYTLEDVANIQMWHQMREKRRINGNLNKFTNLFNILNTQHGHGIE
jgi:hypothetical protein